MNKYVYDALIYACGKGRQKEWARENLITKMLYDTDDEVCIYLKFKDKDILDKCDEETEEYYIYKFGYHLPKTEIDLYVSKKDNRLFIKKEGLGYGYYNVEKAIYEFIKEQIKIKNVYLRTNLNGEEYLIK